MSTNIHLSFPSGISMEPVVCNLVRLFDLDFNITTAHISERREGFLILELLGSTEKCRQAVDYLRGRGISVTPVLQYIQRDEALCVECGLCTAICHSSALRMTPDRHLEFNKERCTVCKLCIRECPVHALHMTSDV